VAALDRDGEAPRGEQLGVTDKLTAWLLFRPADRLVVRNSGPAPLWLTPQRDESNVIVVEAGDELSVPADATAPRWAVHFGLPHEPHRLIRFFRLRTRRSET
jgi:hypothetical protein